MGENSPWSRRRPSDALRSSSPLGDPTVTRTGAQSHRPPDRAASSDHLAPLGNTPPGARLDDALQRLRTQSPTSQTPRKRTKKSLAFLCLTLFIVSVFGALLTLVNEDDTAESSYSKATTAASINSTDSVFVQPNNTTLDSVFPPRTNIQSNVVNWDEVSRSIVFIEASSPCDWRGSGTIVLDGTFILTNQHVSASGECDLRVGLTDNLNSTPSISLGAVVLVADEVLDLAVLRLLDSSGRPFASREHRPVEIDASQPPLGSEIATLGYPALGSYDAGMTITFTRGTFSGIDFTDGKFYKTDATMRGGVSGGGAFNSSGKLIGVPTAGLIDEDSNDPVGINLIRPIEFAKSLLEEAQTTLQANSLTSVSGDVPGELTGQVTNVDPRFDTCKEAIRNGYGPYIDGIHVEYDWYIDRDGDGVVCER